MKKKSMLVLAAIIMIVPQLVSAFEVGVQPRFKTGVMYYQYEQDAFQSPPRDPQGLFPNTASDLKYSDWMPFVGGGLTLFAHRFFLDFSIQYAFNGKDSDNTRNQNFLTAGEFITTDSVLTTEAKSETDIDRIEGALSVGFKATDNIALFAGWLKAETTFDTSLRGDIATFRIPNLTPIPFLTGTFSGDLKQKLNYNGPFVGTNLTMPIKKGFLDGALSGLVSIAFLDGEVDLDFKNVLITKTSSK